MHMSSYLSVYVCLSVCLAACLPARLPACLSVCLSKRSRRFREEGDALEGFDRNAVTPGTDFMVALTARLMAWAEANRRKTK